MCSALDAVAFLWKRLGSTCQNERKGPPDPAAAQRPAARSPRRACCSSPRRSWRRWKSPNTLAKMRSWPRNARWPTTPPLMALLWDATATKNAKLLCQGLKSLPGKLDRATWLNYVRCHDDIGFGFDDQDIRAVGYEPRAHRRFLTDYFTGSFDGQARGLAFNPRRCHRRCPNLRFVGFTGGPGNRTGSRRSGPDPSGHRPDLAAARVIPVLRWHPADLQRRRHRHPQRLQLLR